VQRVDQAFTGMLVLLAQQGERAALERLAARWRPRHYAHARRLLGSADGAGDAVQDAWVAIVRGIGRLREPERFPAWSYAIVTHRCQDLVRRRMREPKGDPDADPLDPTPADNAQRTDLRRAIVALPPDQRAAVALFYIEGFGVEEIAQALLTPAGTIKTRLFHARRALRAQLGASPEGEET
jgi:RNA polymerase sigma factor (sigma-70 family)